MLGFGSVGIGEYLPIWPLWQHYFTRQSRRESYDSLIANRERTQYDAARLQL
jgi:hypothetical protein